MFKLITLFIFTYFFINCSLQQTELESCLKIMINKHINNGEFLTVYIEGDLGASLLRLFEIKMLYNSQKIRFLLDKSKYYFIVPEQTNASVVFRRLSNLSTWNPSAIFFIVAQNKTEIFEAAAKYYIQKIIVIDLSDKSTYTYSYTCEEHLKILYMGSWENGTDFNIFSKKSTDWYCYTLRILAMPVAPYIYFDNNKNLDGLEIRSLQTIQQKMGFKIKFIDGKYKTWGLRLPNGTYTDMFQKLQTNEADAVMGMWPNNYTHFWDFDASKPYLQDALVWLVPKAQILPHWKRLAIIFPENIWLILFITVLLVPILWTIAAKFLSAFELKSFQNLQTSLFKSISIILVVTLPKYPKTACLRILFIIWVCTSLILVTIYQSRLLAILILPQYEDQMAEVKEILNSGIKFGGNVNIRALYDGTVSEIERKFYENMIICDLTLTCPNRTAYERDFATAKSRLPAYFLIWQYFTNADGSPMIHVFKSTILTHYVSTVFAKGHPMFEEFNKLVVRIFESGLFLKWKDDIREETLRRAFLGKTYSDNSLMLSLRHMITAFVILVIGYVLSAIVFILENLYAKLHKKIK